MRGEVAVDGEERVAREAHVAADVALGEASEQGRVLWSPPADVLDRTRIGDYLRWLDRERSLRFADYASLWRWSVDDLPAFWSSVWDYFQVRGRVVRTTTEGAREHIETLSRKYLGGPYPWYGGRDQVRVLFVIEPLSISSMG